MSASGVSSNDATKAPKLYKFVGKLFIWLIVWFMFWYFVSSVLAAPAVWLSEAILTFSLPDFVYEFSLIGSQAVLVSNFGELNGEIVSARLAGDHLAFLLNTQILTYSLPFYAALHFATNKGVKGIGLIWGLCALYLLLVIGMISICLKNLMVGLGPTFVDGFSATGSFIGVMFQFSTLMVPTLAPLLIWAWQSRNSSYLRQLMAQK
jgi:hypothetical protein